MITDATAPTLPPYAVAGDVLTAAFWNTNVRDNISALSGVFSYGRGIVAFATDSTQTSLSTSTVDISGLSVTWTAVAGQNYLVLACVAGLIKQTNLGNVRFTITDGSNNVKATHFDELAVNETEARSILFEVIKNARAGSTTRKLRQITAAAGGVFNRGDVADNFTFIAIIDLGNTTI
jgi:hypothetical protein